MAEGGIHSEQFIEGGGRFDLRKHLAQTPQGRIGSAGEGKRVDEERRDGGELLMHMAHKRTAFLARGHAKQFFARLTRFLEAPIPRVSRCRPRPRRTDSANRRPRGCRRLWPPENAQESAGYRPCTPGRHEEKTHDPHSRCDAQKRPEPPRPEEGCGTAARPRSANDARSGAEKRSCGPDCPPRTDSGFHAGPKCRWLQACSSCASRANVRRSAIAAFAP